MWKIRRLPPVIWPTPEFLHTLQVLYGRWHADEVHDAVAFTSMSFSCRI
jgi:hypothetical protein